jgi:hypothetical protein
MKFRVKDSSKFIDFQKLYNHLVDVRQPNFEFKEEIPDFNWTNMNDKEVEEALEIIDASFDDEAIALKRYDEVIPNYANLFFKKYFKIDNDKLGNFGVQEVLSIFNYLEFGFEVDLNKLEVLDENISIVEFSTGNYPFGGLERFFITLKAFNLIPIECFDGFSVNQIDWESDFKFNFIELQEQTKIYLGK